MKKPSSPRALRALHLVPLAALSAFVAVLGASGCQSSPEGYCESLAADACDVLAGCCKNGAKFDHETCILAISAGCQDTLRVEDVHRGDVVFDSGAASDCFGGIETCDDLDKARTLEQEHACRRVISGYRPIGAACSDSDQCEVAGEYTECLQGGVGAGVCAEVETSSDGNCGFDFASSVLTVCGEEQFCDTSGYVPDASKSPTAQQLEVKGTCKPLLDVGATCGGANQTCKSALYCDFNAGNPVCANRKGEGEACQSSSECQDNLDCDFNGTDQVCAKSQGNGSFCFLPSACGDGQCDPSEQSTCPADCGPQPFCGDGSCEGSEPETCPQDCAQPVAECGDGTCDSNGSEPALCPQDCCGDGFCDTGEDAVCPTDCGA